MYITKASLYAHYLDPYPKVNATDNQGYSYIIKENEESALLVTFEVEAFMFTPKQTKANISLMVIAGKIDLFFTSAYPAVILYQPVVFWIGFRSLTRRPTHFWVF